MFVDKGAHNLHNLYGRVVTLCPHVCGSWYQEIMVITAPIDLSLFIELYLPYLGQMDQLADFRWD